MVIVEIGGTVGDIESLPFIEAIRQMRQDMGRENTLFVHVTLVPYIGAAGELKTKPTQHSVKELLSVGIQPDILLCRTDRFLSKDIKSKIALFCNVEEEAVITAKDVNSIYEVPLTFSREGVDELVLKYLHIDAGMRDISRWEELVQPRLQPQGRGYHRPGRQVRGVRGFLQVAEGSAGPRRAGAQSEAQLSLDRGRGSGDARARNTNRNSKATTASWCPAASASAALPAC